MVLIIIELSCRAVPVFDNLFALVQIFRETSVDDSSWLLQVSLQDHGMPLVLLNYGWCFLSNEGVEILAGRILETTEYIYYYM